MIFFTLVSCSSDEKQKVVSNTDEMEFLELLSKKGIHQISSSQAQADTRSGDVCVLPSSCPVRIVRNHTFNVNAGSPNFNCNVAVPVNVYECYLITGELISLQFEIADDISQWIFSNSQGCEELNQYLEEILFFDPIQFDKEVRKIYRVVINEIESSYMEAALIYHQQFCPSSGMQASFVERQCKAICVTNIITVDGPLFNLQEVHCGDACCVRSRDYCYNTVTGEVEASEYSLYSIDECEAETVNCGESIATCNAPCDRLNG